MNCNSDHNFNDSFDDNFLESSSKNDLIVTLPSPATRDCHAASNSSSFTKPSPNPHDDKTMNLAVKRKRSKNMIPVAPLLPICAPAYQQLAPAKYILHPPT